MVTRDPAIRHDQRRRVVHEVEQVIEPAARISRRPTVKLGLHLRYPRPRPHRSQAGSAAIHQRVLRHCSILISSIPLPPFPMHRALPGSEYYGGSAPPPAAQPTTCSARPPRRQRAGRAGQGRFPCSLRFAHRRRSPALPQRPRHGYAADLPRSLPVTSFTAPGSSPPQPSAGTRRSRPSSARFEPVRALRGVKTPVPRVLLSGPLTGHTPSGSANAPRLCQDCSHPARRLPGKAVLSSHQAAATARR